MVRTLFHFLIVDMLKNPELPPLITFSLFIGANTWKKKMDTRVSQGKQHSGSSQIIVTSKI